MFDFAPVGAGLTIAGLIFISLVGWRLLPTRRSKQSDEDLFPDKKNYITDCKVRVTDDSDLIGTNIQQLTKDKDIDIKVLGIVPVIKKGYMLQGPTNPFPPSHV